MYDDMIFAHTLNTNSQLNINNLIKTKKQDKFQFL